MSKQEYTITAYGSENQVLRTRTITGKREAKQVYANAISIAARLGGYAKCEPDPYAKPVKAKDGITGQDRESYTDTQDRESYVPDPTLGKK